MNAIDPAQKLQKLLVAVPLMKIANDCSLQQIEDAKQRNRSVALIIGVMVPERPFFKGRPG